MGVQVLALDWPSCVLEEFGNVPIFIRIDGLLFGLKLSRALSHSYALSKSSVESLQIFNRIDGDSNCRSRLALSSQALSAILVYSRRVQLNMFKFTHESMGVQTFVLVCPECNHDCNKKKSIATGRDILHKSLTSIFIFKNKNNGHFFW